MSLYILFFFIFLEPLKGDIVSYDYPFAYNFIAFFSITGINIFSCILIPYLFPKYFSAENWTLPRFFTWFFAFCLLIIVFSYFFDVSAHKVENIENWTALYFEGYMPPVFIFLASTILAFFFIYNPKTESETILPQTYNQTFETPLSAQIPITTLKFFDTSGKNNLVLTLENLYYVTSANNYIEVFYKKEPTKEAVAKIALSRMLLRNTLKTIEQQYVHLPELYRCHKTFIVNTQKVVAIKGNTKGYSLVLQELDIEIPVSRHKNSELEKMFAHLL